MSEHKNDTYQELIDWLDQHSITEIECMISDITGIARGKILPTKRFVTSVKDSALRLPQSILGQTVTGDFIESSILSPEDPDMILVADPATVRLVPWYTEPTAQIVCDVFDQKNKPITIAPRYVLKKILQFYKEKNWMPIVAPEIEFYLAAKNLDPDLPLEPPIGNNGRRETARQSFGIDAVNEFDKIFEEMYDHCLAQNIDIDTLAHEGGAAQVEVNFHHGDPLELADQIFFFKRTLRQAGLNHGIYITFMAKPFEKELGSAMHIHQNVLDASTRKNLFSSCNGEETDFFLHYIGGLQRHIPSVMAILAPNVNSYRRIMRDQTAPVNVHWGRDNRTVGLRVPFSKPENRRVENRVPGADANPYLAMAATLACGYLGVIDKINPSPEMHYNAYNSKKNCLPRHLLNALDNFKRAYNIRELLGKRFSQVYLDVKYTEHGAYQQVVSAWEREHLLLNV